MRNDVDVCELEYEVLPMCIDGSTRSVVIPILLIVILVPFIPEVV